MVGPSASKFNDHPAGKRSMRLFFLSLREILLLLNKDRLTFRCHAKSLSLSTSNTKTPWKSFLSSNAEEQVRWETSFVFEPFCGYFERGS